MLKINKVSSTRRERGHHRPSLRSNLSISEGVSVEVLITIMWYFPVRSLLATCQFPSRSSCRNRRSDAEATKLHRPIAEEAMAYYIQRNNPRRTGRQSAGNTINSYVLLMILNHVVDSHRHASHSGSATVRWLCGVSESEATFTVNDIGSPAVPS